MTHLVGGVADRVLDVDPLSAGITVDISGVTIRGGRAVTMGGGIRNAGTLVIADSAISNNKAEATDELALGGGIGTGAGSVTTVSSCRVHDNAAIGDGESGTGAGGGLGTFQGELSVSSSTIDGNDAQGPLGGGAGGGVAVFSGTFLLDGSTVQRNETSAAFSALGAGIEIDCSVFGPCGSVSVTASTIAQNEAFSLGSAGGGGVNVSGGSLVLANSTLTQNIASGLVAPTTSIPRPGGGLYLDGAAATIANVTFETNTFVIPGSPELDSTGIHVDETSTATFRNTIVSDSCSIGGAVDAAAHNVEHPGDTCAFSGTDLIGVDPLLGPLADNGGPTETLALLAGSPAIDGADPAAPGSGGDACDVVDQRGVARPVGIRCDIGAYERRCGDGVVDAEEQCDDGAANGASGSCCAATCLARPNGSSCEDNNVCTTLDTCESGMCVSGPCRTGACTYCGGTCSDAGGPCACVF